MTKAMKKMTEAIKSMETRRDETQPTEYHNSFLCYPTLLCDELYLVQSSRPLTMTLNFN